MADLKPGMVLEGTVSNVAAFGAFIDIGVHQDGLVHVSQLANQFVSDAREVVKTGDIVKVRVTEIDLARKRIGLTLRLSDSAETTGGRAGKGAFGNNRFEAAAGKRPPFQQQQQPQQQPASHSAMADAFARLKK